MIYETHIARAVAATGLLAVLCAAIALARTITNQARRIDALKDQLARELARDLA